MSEYEPRVGDMVQVVRPCKGDGWREHQRGEISDCHPVGALRTISLVAPKHPVEPVVESGSLRVLPLSMVAPLRPTRAGQRVRREEGGGLGLTESAVDGFSRVRWDVDSSSVVRLSSLVVIADEPKACPACGDATSHAPECTEVLHHASEEAWTPPRCGRAGHAHECLCHRQWVREAEPEPSVRVVNAYLDDRSWVQCPAHQPGAERLYVASGGGREAVHPTRDGAIAAWRARGR